MAPVSEEIHLFFLENDDESLLGLDIYNHRIGWWENLQESAIFDGKNHGFL